MSWTAPADGGSPITKYTVTPYVGATAQTPTVVTGNPPATTTTVTGLVNNTTYTFTVSATNANGTSPPSVASNPVTPANSPAGQWSALMNWPMVAVHSVLLKNGNLLIWDGWQNPEPTAVWNATSQTFPTTINAPGSIFCSGNVHLPDGRILIAGGDGIFTTGNLGLADTTIFDPATGTWKRVADMNRPRWYPSLTELADGRYVAISGNSTNQTTWADTPEVYDPAADTWTLLTGVSTPQVHEEEYPFSYLAPNGKVFTIGPEEDNSFFLDVAAKTWTPVGGASGVVNGSSVMYRPGKILYSGGAPSVQSSTTAKANAAVIDLTAGTPAWRTVPSMHSARIYHTLTMLADGTVLAVGGENSSDQSIVTSGVLTAEIWDPATETWTNVGADGGGPQLPLDRGAHARRPRARGRRRPLQRRQRARPVLGAVLLAAVPVQRLAPDDRQRSGGHHVRRELHRLDARRRLDPLREPRLARRRHAPERHGPALRAAELHRRLGLADRAGARRRPRWPRPATYMLFIVDDKGVPSVASMVGMSRTLGAPATPAKPTATAGDGQATVSWSAPDDGGSTITKYTVTPYIGATAQTPKDVTGSPAATSTTISGLTNGTAYTFKVSATNAVGTSAQSADSDPVTPAAPVAGALAFVQQVNKRGVAASLALQPTAAVTTGNRLIVQVGVWSYGKATASGVTDSAGNTYTKLTSVKASDDTELSVWSAPITAGGGTRPTVTVTATGSADIGAGVLEYSGLSTAAGTGRRRRAQDGDGHDQCGRQRVLRERPRRAPRAGELAMGFYADSGFGNALTGDPTYTVRTNVSPTGDMELLAQDRVLTATGTTANPTTRTGASTPWLAATVVLKSAAPPAGGARPWRRRGRWR